MPLSCASCCGRGRRLAQSLRNFYSVARQAIASSGHRHLAEQFGAAAARLGAFLAMVVRVLGAFGPAGLANRGRYLSDLLGERAATRRESGRHAADGRAVDIERDAMRHHVDVVLLQTGCCAMIAGVSAGIASGHAGLVYFMRHTETP